MTLFITETNNVSITNTYKKITYEIKSNVSLSSGKCKSLIAAIAFGQDYDFKALAAVSGVVYIYSVTVSVDSSD